MAVNVGVLEAVLKMKDEMTPTLSKAASAVGDFAGKHAGSLAIVGAAGAGAAAAVAGVAAAATAAAVSMIKYSGTIVDLADKYRTTTDAVQKFKFAAEQSGTSIEVVLGASKKLSKNLGEGTEKTAEAVKALGLSMKDLANSTPERALSAVLTELSKVDNAARQSAIGTQLLGRNFAELLPMAGNLEQLTAEAERLGLVLSEKDLRAAEALGDAFDALGSMSMALVNNLGSVITSNESLHVAVEGVTAMFADMSRMVSDNKGALNNLVSQGVLLVLSAMQGLIVAIKYAVDAWSGFKIALTAVTAASDIVALQIMALWDLLNNPGNFKQILADLADNVARVGKEAVEATNKEMAANAQRQAILDTVSKKLDEVKTAAAGAVGKTHEMEQATRKSSAASEKQAESLSKSEQAMIKAANAARVFALALKYEEQEAQMREIDHMLQDQARAHEEVGKAAQLAGRTQQEELQMAITLAQQELYANIARAEQQYKVAEALFKTGLISKSSLDQARTNWENLKNPTKQATEATFDYAQALDVLSNALQALGVSADSGIMKMVVGLNSGLATMKQVKAIMTDSAGKGISFVNLTNAQKGQVALAGLNTAVTAYKSGVLGGAAAGASFGASFGPWGAAIGGAAGALLGFVGGLGKAKKEMAKLKEDFISSAGGIDALRAKAAEAGINLEFVFSAKNPKEMADSIKQAQDAMDLYDEAIQKTKAAMEEFGLTVEDMGPKWQQQELDKQAMSLFEKYSLLTAAGAEHNVVLERMAPAINEYLQAAMRTGAEVPSNLEPIIRKMFEMGLLTDETGAKLGSLDGVTFGKTMSEALMAATEAVNRLTNALMGIPNITRHVTIVEDYVNGGGPSSQSGSGGQQRAEAEARAEEERRRHERRSAGGFDGWVNGPTRFLAGEAGSERVTITPAHQARSGGGGDGGGGSLAGLERRIDRMLDLLPKAIRDGNKKI